MKRVVEVVERKKAEKQLQAAMARDESTKAK